MKHLEVVAGILRYDGKVLCMERGAGKYDYVSYKYEFPGGKIESGEAKHAALERELREEMNIRVTVREEDLYMTVRHEYPDFSITMYAFTCDMASPEFVRKEHVNHQWLRPEELPTLDWAGADIPIMEKLAKG
jgi:8-oxo-dGTP diphosphatase